MNMGRHTSLTDCEHCGAWYFPYHPHEWTCPGCGITSCEHCGHEYYDVLEEECPCCGWQNLGRVLCSNPDCHEWVSLYEGECRHCETVVEQDVRLREDFVQVGFLCREYYSGWMRVGSEDRFWRHSWVGSEHPPLLVQVWPPPEPGT